MKILAKNHRNRRSLEISASAADPAKDVIEGTRAELAQFGLSDLNVVHGVRVVITDDPTPKGKQVKRPERGERKESKIN